MVFKIKQLTEIRKYIVCTKNQKLQKRNSKQIEKVYQKQ